MPQGFVALWAEYASGLFQQILPTRKDKPVTAQLVEEVGKHPVVARCQWDSQFAFQRERRMDASSTSTNTRASLAQSAMRLS